jgi:hypothetical protein
VEKAANWRPFLYPRAERTMPKKAKVGRSKRPRRTKQERDVERFLEDARSIGIDPTYNEFRRALKGLISPKRRLRKGRRAS